MSISAQKRATNPAGSQTFAGLPEGLAQQRREMGHNALENYLETKSVVAQRA